MDKMRNCDGVNKQYSDSEKLRLRMKLHQKYSTNKQGFGNWIFEQYKFSENMKILELGCGEGSMWETYYERLPAGCNLTLTDFSEGMIGDAKRILSLLEGIEYACVDIQNISYEAVSFDAVIANMMLYHVPDIDRGLSEVRRVMKCDSSFYCATFGEHGIAGWLNDLLSFKGFCISENNSFTLQNGAEVLKKHFDDVTIRIYEDSLEVTEIEDIADYILSLDGVAVIDELERGEILSILQGRMKDGVITIPKEYGMFISK